jgi:hypothetical protein
MQQLSVLENLHVVVCDWRDVAGIVDAKAFQFAKAAFSN